MKYPFAVIDLGHEFLDSEGYRLTEISSLLSLQGKWHCTLPERCSVVVEELSFNDYKRVGSIYQRAYCSNRLVDTEGKDTLGKLAEGFSLSAHASGIFNAPEGNFDVRNAQTYGMLYHTENLIAQGVTRGTTFGESFAQITYGSLFDHILSSHVKGFNQGKKIETKKMKETVPLEKHIALLQ